MHRLVSLWTWLDIEHLYEVTQDIAWVRPLPYSIIIDYHEKDLVKQHSGLLSSSISDKKEKSFMTFKTRSTTGEDENGKNKLLNTL